jgi:hypothetical protein
VLGDKTLKKGDRKAYSEVAPQYPLSGYIRHVGSKSIVIPASGRRGGAIAPSDLAKVLHMDEVTSDTIDLPLRACALKRGVHP